MKQKPQPKKQVPQESTLPRIIIEFEGVGRSDPNVHFSQELTRGQIRDAALLLYTMAQRHVFDQMTQMQVQEMQGQPKIVRARGSLQ